jgi:hypothetical protein
VSSGDADVIYFLCPDCKEELEAEDSILGTRMNCPACSKDIEVPRTGIKISSPRGAKTERREASPPGGAAVSGVMPGARFILVVVVAGALALLAFSGVGYYLNLKHKHMAGGGDPCGVCNGKKTVACARCNGAKNFPCKECAGTGRRKNFREEEEACFNCNGSGHRACPICGGRGEYSCAPCNGTGVRGGKAPEEPKTFKQ